MPYDSDAGRGTAAAITALMTGRAYRSSAQIAAAIGTYERYAGEPRAAQRRHADAPRRVLRDPGRDLRRRRAARRGARARGTRRSRSASEHGYRNAQATVLAPTGTISFLMDCDTTGVEPDFSLVKFKELVGGGQMTIVNRTVPLALADARLRRPGRSSRSRRTSTSTARSSARPASPTSTCRCSTWRSASARSRTWATSR